MIELYSPRGEMELLLLRSILDDAGIPYFVHNDTFGSLYSGRYAEAYNRKILYVPEAHLGEARVLLREFFERTGQGGPPREEPPRVVALLGRALQEAARRWPPYRRGPLARRLWAYLDAWGEVDEPAARRRFQLIRNESKVTGPPREGAADSGTKAEQPPLRLV